MRLEGYFTVEAAYIFVIFTLIVVWLLKIDFYIHDIIINDSGKVLGAIRYRQTKLYYYDVISDDIDCEAIIASPVLKEDEKKVENAKQIINKLVDRYFESGIIGNDVVLSDTDISEILTLKDNAKMVRAGNEAVKIIGGE